MKNDIWRTETNMQGAGDRQHVVRGTADDRRDWLATAPVCVALARQNIAHVGVAEVRAPYRVVRSDLSGSFVMACCGGEGRVWVDGRWRKIRAGQACVSPPHVVHAHEAVGSRPWEIVWVRYQEPPGSRPIASVSSPVMAAFDGRPLRAAALGLFHEAGGEATPTLMNAWVQLIEGYVRHFLHPWKGDDRLRQLWEIVATSLQADWTVEKLANEIGLSTQQLRRLCLQHLGRKPAEHLASLRIQQAARLLSESGEKIETIAHLVGFHSGYTFSRTFRRLTGCRPSEYRIQPLR